MARYIDDLEEEINDDFLDDPPSLKPLPRLKTYNMDLGEIPESLREKAKTARMVCMMGVRFGEFGKVYDFFCDDDEEIIVGDAVVAENPGKGIMMGWVAKAPVWFDNSEVQLKLKKIQRLATDDDFKSLESVRSSEERGLMKVKEHIAKLGLEMEALRVEYTLDLRKAIVYFSAENRVDFRGLLKELVHDLKAKVDLRQIGVRDQAKMKGGIGPCGEELCCSKHIKRFHAVNIKMAKDQNLSLKPTRVSGMCGRLKCCLQYEQDAYRDLVKGVPHVGQKIRCTKGCGKVMDLDILRQFVIVEFDDGTISKVDIADLLTEKSQKKRYEHKNEKMVATSDQDQLLDQIKSARSRGKKNDSVEKSQDAKPEASKSDDDQKD